MRITDLRNPWRDRLRPASFRGVGFHVEVGARAGGRRVVVHEYPKRDRPYAEDMGRRAIAMPITGYLIGPDYLAPRDRLIDALETEGPGSLVHPTLGEFVMQCGPYSVTEHREKGGYCVIEMQFVEAGAPGNGIAAIATQALVALAAADAATVVSGALDRDLGAAQ